MEKAAIEQSRIIRGMAACFANPMTEGVSSGPFDALAALVRGAGGLVDCGGAPTAFLPLPPTWLRRDLSLIALNCSTSPTFLHSED